MVDFGDGSDPVHEYDAVHTYTVEGTHTATPTVVDENGLTAEESVKILVGCTPGKRVHPSSNRRCAPIERAPRNLC